MANKGVDQSLVGDFQMITADLVSGYQDNNNDESDDCWICKRCTLENPGPANLCLACGRPKIRKAKKNPTVPESPVDGSWNCQFCTLKNAPNVNKVSCCFTMSKHDGLFIVFFLLGEPIYTDTICFSIVKIDSITRSFCLYQYGQAITV